MRSLLQIFKHCGSWLAKQIGYEESKGLGYYLAKQGFAIYQTFLTVVVVFIPVMALFFFHAMGNKVPLPTFSDVAISAVGSSISFIAIYFKFGANRRFFGELNAPVVINMIAIVIVIGLQSKYATNGDISSPGNKVAFAILCVWTLITMFDVRRIQYSEQSNLVEARQGDYDDLNNRVFGGK